MSEKTLTQRLADAKAAVQTAMKFANQLDEQHDEEVVQPLRKSRVGQCYRYKSNGPDSQTWVRLTGVYEFGYVTLSVSKLKEGVRVQQTEDYIDNNGEIHDHYEKVTYDEWRKAVDPLLKSITSKV